ncbi:hypothetical protein ADICYQ_3120 [Cyclobacterium qasimii M12-11B]|uniref:Uncharacterized protein n=1 Tax=Cyclobacterium qasimii M12-11B TaxID=641524 RepID=S7WVE0_9BACT|nr:hypothetical protein ADICYQ_3120 [Cyclobacterium qasimii M12-11B]
MSALGKEDYTHFHFGGIVAFFSATMLTKSSLGIQIFISFWRTVIMGFLGT